MAKFRTPFTSMDEKKPLVEVITGISETIPDQSLTVREILTKYAQGTLDDIAQYDYDGNDDMPDLRGLDITELQQMKHDAQMDIDEINAMIALHNQVPEEPKPKRKAKSDPSPSDVEPSETPEHI